MVLGNILGVIIGDKIMVKDLPEYGEGGNSQKQPYKQFSTHERNSAPWLI
jgi:hypothetical protein